MANSYQDCFFFSGICPLLCSGHGVYGGGECHCVDGWKGPECEVRITECIVADCSGHGHCREGVCLCERGWSGDHCQNRKFILRFEYRSSRPSYFYPLFTFLCNFYVKKVLVGSRK